MTPHSSFYKYLKCNKSFILFGVITFVFSFSIFQFFNLEFILNGNDDKAALCLDSGGYYQYFIKNLDEFTLSKILRFETLIVLNPALTSFRFSNHLFALVGGNLYLLYFLHFFLYLFIIRKFYIHFQKQEVLLYCFALYPYVYTSFSPANKEITSILSIMYFSYFILTKNYWYLFPSLILSFSSRIELMIFLCLFTGLLIIGNQFKSEKFKRYFYYSIVICSIFGLNILINYYKANRIEELEKVKAIANFGFYPYLAEKTYNGWFFLTFPFHILMNFFGNLHVVKYHFSILNPFFTYLSEVYLLILSGMLFLKKKIQFNSELLILFLMYSLVFSITPTVVHRYIIPMYPLIIIFYVSWEDRK